MKCWKCGEVIEDEQKVIRSFESWGEPGDQNGNKAGFRMHLEFIQHSPDDKICQKCVNQKFHEFAMVIAEDTKPK